MPSFDPLPPLHRTHKLLTRRVVLYPRWQELADALDKAGIVVDEAGLLMIVEKSEEDLVKAGFKMVHARKLKQIVSKYRVVEQIPEQPGIVLAPPRPPMPSTCVCACACACACVHVGAGANARSALCHLNHGILATAGARAMSSDDNSAGMRSGGGQRGVVSEGDVRL